MTDWLSVMERGLKAVRYGIFQASDNLAMLLDGFCRAPEAPAVVASNERVAGAIAYADAWGYVHYGADGDVLASGTIPDSAAGSPQNAAVVAPSPKQGSDSPPRDSAIPPGALGGHHFHVEASLGYRGICEACGSQVTALLPSELAVWRCIADKGGRCKSCEKSEQ